VKIEGVKTLEELSREELLLAAKLATGMAAAILRRVGAETFCIGDWSNVGPDGVGMCIGIRVDKKSSRPSGHPAFVGPMTENEYDNASNGDPLKAYPEKFIRLNPPLELVPTTN
jgi:hypothetical protein